MTESDRSGFGRALGVAAFRRLIAHHALSSIGQSLSTVAVATALLGLPGGRAWVPIASGARFAPYLLFSPLAGALADRFGCRRLLAWSAVTRTVLTVALAWCVWRSAPAALITGLVFVVTTAGTPTYPALAALLPWSVPAVSLGAANSIFSMVESVSWIVGPALGGLLLLTSSPMAVLICNVAVLAVASVVLPGPQPATEPAAQAAQAAAEEAAPPGKFHEPKTSVGSVLRDRDVLAPLVLVLAVNLVFGGASVGLVLFSTERLDAGGAGAGLLQAALGVGSIVGVVAAERMVRHDRSIRALAAGVLVAGLPLAALGLTTSLTIATVLMVVSGVGSIITEVVSLTLLQRSVPRAALARVFGVLDALVVGSILVGSTLALPLTDLIGLRGSLLAVGAVLPAAAVLGAMRLVALSRRADAQRGRLADRVELMSGLRWLAGVPEPTIEALAAASVVERRGPGEQVIGEGDPPVDLYAIISGRVEVTRRGRDAVVTLGTGEEFGEVGLLRGAARNATVSTVEPTVVLRIPGRAFLDAVSNAPSTTGVSIGVEWMGRFSQDLAD